MNTARSDLAAPGPPVPVPPNPFPGLRPFREDEEYLFFGRENQVDAMVDKLAATRFLAVVGTSGSGKSSLVNCGLRPALRGGLMARAGTAWRMAQFRPGTDPLRAMARALAQDGVLFRDYEDKGLSLVEIVDTTLRMSKLGLVDIYEQAQLGEDVNLLVVVDQFEELFRYRQLGAGQQENVYGVSEAAAAFVNLLLEARTQATHPIYVALTMRSDFLGDCTQFPGLAEAINAGQYLVPRMTRDERREAIRGPAGVGGAEISPVLLTRLVNDVGDNPDQLSILQHALNRTWARWQNEGGGKGPLDLAHYEAIGTMAHALDQHAERAYAELGTTRKQQLCEKVFKALTDKATDPRGVRRPTTLGTLCALADATAAEVTEVIDVFRKASRSFLMPPAGEALAAETVIDISHESLMRVWRRLNMWADEEAQSAQTYRRLADAAARHAAGKASLWRDPDLQLTLDWRDQSQPNDAWASRYHPGFAAAMRFVTQSSEAREAERAEREEQRRRELAAEQDKAEAQARHARRMRWAALFSSALALAAVIAGGIAYWAEKNALQQRDLASQATTRAEGALAEAETQRNDARAQRDLAKQEQARAESERRRAETEAAKAARARFEAEGQRTAAVKQTRVAEEQRQKADEERQKADEQTRKAEEQTRKAEEQKRVADEQTQVAESERQRADSQRITALARQLAAQANLVQRDTPNRMDLIALLATESLRRQPLFDNDRLVREALLLLRPLQRELPAEKVVQAVGWSPDGGRIAAATEDGTVLVWPREGDGTPLQLGHAPGVRGLAWSGDARRLAVAVGDRKDRSVHIWDAQSGHEIGRLKHDNAVVAVVWSADGRRIASASRDKTARLWDADSRGEIHRFSHPNPLLAIALSVDGKQLATADESEVVRVWSAESGRELVSLPNYGRVDALAWSPDGKRLACGYKSDVIRVWDVASAKELGPPLNHQYPVTALAWSPDGQYLASGSNDRTARVWEAEAGHEVARLVHEDNITGVTWSPDSRFLASGGRDKRVRVWDVRPADGPVRLVHKAKIQTVAASADGRFVASASGDGKEHTVRGWESGTGREVFNVRQPERVQALAWNPGASLLAAGTIKGAVIVLEAATGKERFRLDDDGAGPLLAIDWSPDGQGLAAAGDKSTPIVVWDLATRRPGPRLRHDPRVCCVAWSPDSQYIASGGDDKTVRVWQASTGREVMQMRHDNPVRGLDWSRDGLRLASGGGDLSTRIWNSRTGAELQRLPHRGRSIPLAWSKDGSLLATASGAIAHLWRTTGTGEELLRIPLAGGARAGLLSEDGATLITISEAGRALVVDRHPLKREELLRQVCAHLLRNLSREEWKEYVGEETYEKTCPDLPRP